MVVDGGALYIKFNVYSGSNMDPSRRPGLGREELQLNIEKKIVK